VLLPIIERVQGREHPDALNYRSDLAYWTEQAKAARPDARLLTDTKARQLADRACELLSDVVVYPEQTEASKQTASASTSDTNPD
jgi:hypothetical protein